MSAEHTSHLVPDGGLDAWPTPNASQPAVARLDRGVPVSVIQRHGDWAQVLCTNGWSGWVDGRLLVPIDAAPSPPAGPRPHARSRVPVLVTITVVVALIAGAIAISGGDDGDGGTASGSSGSGEAGGPLATTGALATTPLPAELALLQRPLDLFTTERTGDDAQSAFEQLGAAMVAVNDDGADLGAVQAAVDESVWRTLSTDAGAEALLATADALDGHRFTLLAPPALETSGGETPVGTRLRATPGVQTGGPPTLSVYYVNGVMNTPPDALAGALQVVNTLAVAGVTNSLTLVYNRSAVTETTWRQWACARGIATNHPASELVNSLCGFVLGGIKPIDYASAAAEVLTRSAPQLFFQRGFDLDLASSAVNQGLLPLVQADVVAGRRVLLVSHSQGGLFVRNALGQLQEWWKGDPTGAVATGCPVALPVRAEYIAPPFGSGQELNADPSRYVMLSGDWLLGLFISSATPTSTPVPPQSVDNGIDPLGPFRVHYLENYLSPASDFLAPGSESRQQVMAGARELTAGAPNRLQSTDTCAPPTTTSPSTTTTVPVGPPPTRTPKVLTVSGVSPSSARLDETVTLTISGTGFLPLEGIDHPPLSGGTCEDHLMLVLIYPTGRRSEFSVVSPGPATSDSDGSLHLEIRIRHPRDLDPWDVGPYDVEVGDLTQYDQPSTVVCSGCFTVTAG